MAFFVTYILFRSCSKPIFKKKIKERGEFFKCIMCPKLCKCSTPCRGCREAPSPGTPQTGCPLTHPFLCVLPGGPRIHAGGFPAETWGGQAAGCRQQSPTAAPPPPQGPCSRGSRAGRAGQRQVSAHVDEN